MGLWAQEKGPSSTFLGGVEAQSVSDGTLMIQDIACLGFSYFFAFEAYFQKDNVFAEIRKADGPRNWERDKLDWRDTEVSLEVSYI